MADVKLSEVPSLSTRPPGGMVLINNGNDIKQIPADLLKDNSELLDVVKGNSLLTHKQIVKDKNGVQRLATNFIDLEAGVAHSFVTNLTDFVSFGYFDKNDVCTDMMNTSGDGLVIIPANAAKKFAYIDNGFLNKTSQIEWVISGNDRTAYVADTKKIKTELYDIPYIPDTGSEDQSWTIVYEETLTEAKNVTVSDLDCTEVEAYVICEEAAEGNFYLTSSDAGTIYGDPLVWATGKGNPFIMEMRLEIVTPFLWKGSHTVNDYFGVGGGASPLVGYQYKILNEPFNKPKITGITIAKETTMLPIGTRIIVRSRNVMPSQFLVTESGDIAYLASTEQLEASPLTATAQQDIRQGMVAVTNEGIVTGEKNFPSYETTEGYKLIMPGSELKIKLVTNDKYDYTKLQAVICLYETTLSQSVNAEKVSVDNGLYQSGTTEKISDIVKETENKTINFGITNDGTIPLVIRYFTYKEVE